MRMARLGAMDLPTALALLAGAAFGSAAWLTSTMVCAANGAWPLLIAAAAFVPVGVVHGCRHLVRWMVTSRTPLSCGKALRANR